MLKQFTKAKLPADNKTCHQSFRTHYQLYFPLQVETGIVAEYQNDALIPQFVMNNRKQKPTHFSNSFEITHPDLLRDIIIQRYK